MNGTETGKNNPQSSHSDSLRRFFFFLFQESLSLTTGSRRISGGKYIKLIDLTTHSRAHTMNVPITSCHGLKLFLMFGGSQSVFTHPPNFFVFPPLSNRWVISYRNNCPDWNGKIKSAQKEDDHQWDKKTTGLINSNNLLLPPGIPKKQQKGSALGEKKPKTTLSFVSNEPDQTDVLLRDSFLREDWRGNLVSLSLNWFVEGDGSLAEKHRHGNLFSGMVGACDLRLFFTHTHTHTCQVGYCSLKRKDIASHILLL